MTALGLLGGLPSLLSAWWADDGGAGAPAQAGSIPLAWALAAYPAGPTVPTAARTVGQRAAVVSLQVGSPNTVVVSAVADPERAIPITPTSVTWRLVVAGTPTATGTATASGDTWRLVIPASAVPAVVAGAVLEITATPAGSDPTVRRYPLSYVED